jgi:hypothetical protein
MLMTDMNYKKSPVWGLVFLIVLIAIPVVFAYRTQIYAELWALKLVPENTAFTELYFENPSSLPQHITANQPLSFAFTIHNVEGITTTYPYSAYLQYPSGLQVVFASGTTTLSSNASTTIDIQHMFYFSNQNPEVVVKLTSLSQQIDFYVSPTP